jgi:hypothetical protein
VSKPKRYTAAGNGVVRTDPKGDLVLYVDYLRLLIEVDELKSQPDPLTAYLYAAELAKDDIKRLKAEVERLTKAGDAIVSEWANGEEKDAKNFLNALVIWNAAKEGKPRA